MQPRDHSSILSRLGIAIRQRIVVLVLIAIPIPFWPAWWCGREADSFFVGDSFETFAPLVAEAAHSLQSDSGAGHSPTGDWQYDGEWNLVTWQMNGIGLCQLIDRFPDRKSRLAPLVELSIDRLLEPKTRAFDTRRWNEDALEGLSGTRGHLAFLGYANALLSFWRKIEPHNRFAEINDRISEALLQRFRSSPLGLIETYPQEVYPVDNTPALASLALWRKATGQKANPLLPGLVRRLREQYRDAVSGLLYQSVLAGNGMPADKPRVSGTALAAYFLSFVDPALSRELYGSLKACRKELAGFTAFLEYPANVAPGDGDVDSGPVVFGLSVSGTGFSLASARIHHDREVFRGVYRQLYLFGMPYDSGGRRNFLMGGPLGNALALALLTAEKDGGI